MSRPRPRARRAGAALAAVLTATGLALAKPPAPPKPGAAKPAASAAASAAPPAPERKTSGLARVLAELGAGLGPVPPGTLVAVSPLVSDVPAPRAEELATRVAALVAAKLGAKAHPQPATLAVARGAAGRVGSLVFVQLEIAKGTLNATADRYPVVGNGWERLRNPAPGPEAHAFVAAPLDAELRTFLPPIVLEQASVHKAKLEDPDVIALGCGDLDGDGGLELALATRTRVAIARLRGGKLAVERAVPWAELAPRAAVPLREPLGSVVFGRAAHAGELFVGTTDRGAVALDATFGARRALAGLPVPGGDGDTCALAEPAAGALAAGTVACTPAAAKAEPGALATPRADALATLDLVGADGTSTAVVAAREPGGKIRVRRDDGAKELVIDGAGAELALADLDLDGVAELATSADQADGDTITVASLRTTGPAVRLRLPTKDPVRALAACPPEERGAPGLVAVVGGEVWLVR